MIAGGGLFTIAALLVLLAVALVVDFFTGLFEVIAGISSLILKLILFCFSITRFIISRRAIPLPQRNLTRATGGAFALVFVVAASNKFQLDPRAHAVVGIVALAAAIYVWVGYRGSRGIAGDPMAVIWWSCGAAGSAALFIYAPRTGVTKQALVEAAAYGGMAACALRIWLLLRPVAGVKLPHPSTIPGMPMAGPASVHAAHAALGRRGQSARPKFRT